MWELGKIIMAEIIIVVICLNIPLILWALNTILGSGIDVLGTLTSAWLPNNLTGSGFDSRL